MAVACDRRDFALNPLKVIGTAEHDGFFQYRSYISPVKRTRQKARRLYGAFVVYLSPTQEMIRFFRESTHVASRNIQQMAVIFGAVCNATARNRSLVHHGNRQAGRTPQQLDCQHRSAEPASDNNNAESTMTQSAPFRIARPASSSDQLHRCQVWASKSIFLLMNGVCIGRRSSVQAAILISD